MNEEPSEYRSLTVMESPLKTLQTSSFPLKALNICVNNNRTTFFNTFRRRKSRKVFLLVSNQLTRWICEFHMLRKNSVVHEMVWWISKTSGKMQWHNETPMMHFICLWSHMLMTIWGDLLNAYLTELKQ